ncbi:uncharacterized protein LOC108110071 [Drosophila eugracilis]|uniref:uncharacterized protein LOC108110071 n=1 Tax=Drosophila eugracilis TaxID=29029 RepID=UPI0007E7B810|nr:uncharacterized protein LOC108110071 [Drosophila eugracilis]
MEYKPVLQFNQLLFEFFTKLEPTHESLSGAVYALGLKRCGEIIRYNNEDMALQGDLSLSAFAPYWQNFAKKLGRTLRRDDDLLLPGPKERQELIDLSNEWIFPISEISILHKERYFLFFQRRPIIAYVLKSVLSPNENYGRPLKTEHSPTIYLNFQANSGATDGSQELRQYRLQQLYNILLRLVDYSSWRLVDSNNRKKDTLCVSVEAQKCFQKEEPKDHVCIVSGPVLEPVKKTATTLTFDQYLELRSSHMRLMAMHRYGVRPTGLCGMDALMKRLGAAAVIVDLFEVRHATAVTVVRSGLGSSKGASYILYNSARLETILRTFNNHVEDGYYNSLPPLKEIDLSVLEEDMDWHLIFGYLFGFPELLESLVDQMSQGQCGVHLLVRFIENLASAFSRYYRQKKVLVQNRDQLMPILYARIYLMLAVRQVLNMALSLFGIEPVDYI